MTLARPIFPATTQKSRNAYVADMTIVTPVSDLHHAIERTVAIGVQPV